jgi:hypothetical protein
MNKNTTNEKTVSPVIDRIKIAIDMHLKNDCFVRSRITARRNRRRS